MSFLRRVAGLSLRDRVRSSVIREDLGVDPLLLRVERSQMRWLGHLVRMPPGRLPGEVFRARPTGRRPRGRPRTRWRDYVSGWPGNTSGSPGKSWTKWLGRGKSGLPCLGCCPRDPAPDKRQKMDGWMDNATWRQQRDFTLPKSKSKKERKEAIAQILITNFKKKHQRELQELNESHEMQVTEMITFYEHKMRIMADESRKETQAEVDEIDAKYRKLAAEIAAEIDEVLIENGKLFEKSLEVKARRKRLEEEIKQNEEIDRQLTEALQDLQEMKDSIKCLRVRRQQLPDKVRKRILEKILDKALDMLEKHLDVMEADRDVRFTEGDIHQFLEDWRLGGLKELERTNMAAVSEESLTAWLMSAVGDKDKTAAEKIKELIRSKRATRKALKQDLSQLLKEYDDLVRRARGSGKTPPTFNFLKLIRDSLKNTSQNKVLPVLKMIDHVMSLRAAEHLETGNTT